jgi:hypothetical protein
LSGILPSQNDYRVSVIGVLSSHSGILQQYHNYQTVTSDKVYQLLAHGRCFSPGTPASSTTKTGRHNIAEILLKVALNIINQIKSNHNYQT